MRREPQPALLLLLLLLAAACTPPGGMGRADALPTGTARWTGGLELSVVAPDTAQEKPAPLPWMVLSAGHRRGVLPHVEAGARAWIFGIRGFWTWGAQLDGKWQVKRRGRPVSIGLAVSYGQLRLGGTPDHVAGVTVPLLVGHRLGRHQLVFGPRVGWQIVFGEGMHPVDMPLIGWSAGFAWRVGRRLELMPELVITWTPLSLNGETDDESRRGAWSTQVSLGGTWGG